MGIAPEQQAFDAKPVAVSLAHATPGRLRFRAEALKGQSERMHDLVGALSKTPRILRVIGRPATGTLIIDYEDDLHEVSKSILETGVINLVPPAAPMQTVPFSLIANVSWAQADQFVAARTNGMFDARSGAAALFFLAALGQAMNGRILGPTTTLLMGALSLLQMSGNSAPRS